MKFIISNPAGDPKPDPGNISARLSVRKIASLFFGLMRLFLHAVKHRGMLGSNLKKGNQA